MSLMSSCLGPCPALSLGLGILIEKIASSEQKVLCFSMSISNKICANGISPFFSSQFFHSVILDPASPPKQLWPVSLDVFGHMLEYHPAQSHQNMKTRLTALPQMMLPLISAAAAADLKKTTTVQPSRPCLWSNSRSGILMMWKLLMRTPELIRAARKSLPIILMV